MSKKIIDNFDVRIKQPLDKRSSVQSLSDIDRPYDGLIVYQKSDGRHYKYVNGVFKIFNENSIVNVKDFGAKGDRDTDDTQAIQNAINSIKPTSWDSYKGNVGGVVYFPEGTYTITNTIELPAFVKLKGSGMHSTTIFLGNNVNKTIIKTINFDTLKDSGKSWYDTSGVPMGFGISDMELCGNRTFNDNCGGVEIYGYFYTIENLAINYVGGTGFFSNHGNEINGTETYNTNFTKYYETNITNLNIKFCKNRGFDYHKPTDSTIDKLSISECDGDFGGSITGPCYMGNVHIYACNKDVPTGAGLYIGVPVVIDNLTSESNFGGGVSINSYFVHILSGDIYNNKKYSVTIAENSDFSKIDSLIVKLQHNDTIAINVFSKNISFGNVSIYGDYTYTYTKPVIFLNGCDFLTLLNCYIKDVKGVGSIGVAFNQGTQIEGCKANIVSEYCDTAMTIGSGFKGVSDINLLCKRNETQKTIEFDFVIDESDNINIKESINGVYSVLKKTFKFNTTNITLTGVASQAISVTNDTGKIITWFSSNTNVANVVGGTVTGVAIGKCVVIGLCNGMTQICNVNIN